AYLAPAGGKPRMRMVLEKSIDVGRIRTVDSTDLRIFGQSKTIKDNKERFRRSVIQNRREGYLKIVQMLIYPRLFAGRKIIVDHALACHFIQIGDGLFGNFWGFFFVGGV